MRRLARVAAALVLALPAALAVSLPALAADQPTPGDCPTEAPRVVEPKGYGAPPAPAPEPTETCEPTEPPAPPAEPGIGIPANWTFTLDGIDLNNIKPGDQFSVSANGLPPGLNVAVELHSDPVTLARTVVGADGSFAVTARIPLDTPPGHHRIVVVLSGAGLPPTSKDAEVEVLDDGLAPNILTQSLRPIADVVSNPGAIASAVALGIVLIVLSTVPAHLLNATVAEQYQRFEGKLGRLPAWYQAFSRRISKATGIAALGLTTVTALLFGIADPHFGFNDHSLRLIIACAVALFFVAFMSSWITGRILKIQWSISASIALRPFGLLLTLAGVLASRALEFSPGFLIGLILGLTIPHAKIKEYAWRAVAIRSVIIIAFALAAWIGYSTLTLHGEPHDFMGALVVETLVGITTEGIVMLMVDLLPLRLLEGERLWTHSKALWIGIYLVAAVVFILGVLSWEGNWRELGGALWTWLSALSAFAVIGVGVYLYFRFFAEPLPEEKADELEPISGVGEEI